MQRARNLAAYRPVEHHPIKRQRRSDGLLCQTLEHASPVGRGASIPDPSRLFNASLEGNTRRAIDIHEGETVNARAFKALVKAAVARNAASSPATSSRLRIGR